MFERAIEEDAKYIYVEVYIEGYSDSEVIVNPISNADMKLDYLCKTYNDDLIMPHAPIKIISFGYLYDMSQLEYVKNNFEGIK